MKNFYKQGITMLEIMVVLAILGILVAVVLPQFGKIREQQVLKNAVLDVISVVNRARSQTLASVDSSEYGVHFESNQVIIFKGMSYVGAVDDEIIAITTPATISTVTLSGGGSDVYFSRLFGAPSKTGTITIASPSFSKIITISATGGVSVN